MINEIKIKENQESVGVEEKWMKIIRGDTG